MQRTFTILLLTILNGFGIFLLCLRLWSVEKPKVPTAFQSVSIVLTLKILYNIYSNTSRTKHCFWNTALLLVHCVFVHAVDHFDVFKRIKKTHSSETIFSFGRSNPIDVCEPFWMNYQFIVSCAFLLLSFYKPTHCPITTQTDLNDELLMKYRRVLIKRLNKRNTDRHSAIQVGRSSFAKPSSKHSKTTSCTTIYGVLRQDAGDQSSTESVRRSSDCLLRCNGTGDKNFSPSVAQSHLNSMITQTEFEIHACRSMGTQCTKIVYPVTSSKSVQYRLSRASKHFTRFIKNKSTNTSRHYIYSKKIKTKTRGTGPAVKQKPTRMPDAKETTRALMAPIRKHVQPFYDTPSNSIGCPRKIVQPSSKDSGIFNLDDLINGNYSNSSGHDKPRARQRHGLDVIPTKDNCPLRDNSLNVLYITDRMRNSTQGMQNSEFDIDFMRDYSRYRRN